MNDTKDEIGECFAVAAASVPGRSHLLAGRNNQDAFAVGSEGGSLVAVVCDGCGSGRHSEVGAQLGARLVVTRLFGRLHSGGDPTARELWEEVERDVLFELDAVATSLLPAARRDDPQARAATVADWLLFTIVGAVVDSRRAVTFAAGDGAIAVNGQARLLGPFPGNAPPYLGYRLLDSSNPDHLHLAIHHTLATEEVDSLLLGTDGAAELEGLAAAGRDRGAERARGLGELMTDRRFAEHPDALRRQLALLARDRVRTEGGRPIREAGLLADDTTIVLMRRRRHSEVPS